MTSRNRRSSRSGAQFRKDRNTSSDSYLIPGCVSPCQFHVIAAIYTLVNKNWVGNVAVPSGFGTCPMRSGSSNNWYSWLEEDPVTDFAVHPNSQEDEAILGETLENLGRSPSAEKHVRVVLAMKALDRTLRKQPSVSRWRRATASTT